MSSSSDASDSPRSGSAPDLDAALRRVDASTPVHSEGRVRGAVGTVVRADLPGAAIGELTRIRTARGEIEARVVGFDGAEVLLVPLGALDGIHSGSRVERVGRERELEIGPALRGCVLDAHGQILDGDGAGARRRWAVHRDPTAPLSRRPVNEIVTTGLRVVDGLLTLGHGQRVGIFSGPGAGKSTLVRQLLSCAAFDTVVLGLVGERGREVRSVAEAVMSDPRMRDRAVLVVATSDAPAQSRLECAHTATAIAEYFRDVERQRVLLCLDSLTRVARAQREVGLAAGEPPVRRGFPPSLSGLLARLIERAGTGVEGTITGVYTVLTEGMNPSEDPVADEVRGLLDGHIVLSTALAGRGHFPAVDVLESLSRLMPELVGEAHLEAARRLRAMLAARARKADLVDLGAYRRGNDAILDEALDIWPEIEAFLCQRREVRTSFDHTVRQLRAIADV